MNTAELARFSDMVGLIYEGATDPSRWTRDILPALTEYLEAPKCAMLTPLTPPQAGGFHFVHGISQELDDLRQTVYLDEDVWTKAGIAKGMFFEGNVVTGAELVPHAELIESRWYKDVLTRDPGLMQLMTSVVFGLQSTSTMPTICSFFRGLDAPRFNEQDCLRLRLILPHLSRSLGVMQRLRSAELTAAATLDALDRLPSGVLLIDETVTVTFANFQARRMLEDGEGLRLKNLSGAPGLGRLAADDDNADQAITTLISATLSRDPYITPHFSQCVSVPQNSSPASYTLQFSALGNHHEYRTGCNAPAAIIFIADGRQQVKVDPAVLRSAYRLTPTEARVAIVLLDCATLQEAADQLQVGTATVRSHVKQIYAKLGVDTRARFVKLMLGLAGQVD